MTIEKQDVTQKSYLKITMNKPIYLNIPCKNKSITETNLQIRELFQML